MKRVIFFLFMCINLTVILSCVSVNAMVIPEEEADSFVVIGKTQVQFSTWQFLHIYSKKIVQNMAYKRLLKQAQFSFGEDVDVRNIKVNGKYMGWTLLTGGVAFISNFQRNTATADVVVNISQRHDRINRIDDYIPNQTEIITATGIYGAMLKVSRALINDLPENSRVAVISISSDNANFSSYVVDEIEFQLVSSRKFTIVDRNSLEIIRNEQNFQMSGEVSDSSAVSIGQMLGANIVITGNITNIGVNQRLSIRALNVTTTQIVTMAREEY